jgi:predicted metal-dependent enzyme (double-stranded beta helix superfamily)
MMRLTRNPRSAVRNPQSATRGAWALAALALAFVIVAAWPAASQQDDDVLKVIPENYKLLLENPFVRVIEARVPPGTVEPPHRHMRGVSVCMTEYTIESRAVPNGEWVRSERKLGTVYWSEGSLHQLRNVGKTQSHTIRIELKY